MASIGALEHGGGAALTVLEGIGVLALVSASGCATVGAKVANRSAMSATRWPEDVPARSGSLRAWSVASIWMLLRSRSRVAPIAGANPG